jgi:hypothetical protein
MLHLTTDTIYLFSFHGVAVIFTLQNHVTSMYSCRGDEVRYTCRQASSFSNEMADYDDITGCSAQGGGEDLIIMANMNGAAAAPAGYAMSPLSETLWRNKTNTDKVGDTSARVTWVDLWVTLAGHGPKQTILQGITGTHKGKPATPTANF